MNSAFSFFVRVCLVLLPTGVSCFGQSSQMPEPYSGIATAAPEPRPARYAAVKDATALPGKNPFSRYFTTDEFGRTIVFYVAMPPASEQERSGRVPLVVYVQGSGSQSVFSRVVRDGKELAAASGGQGVIRQLARDEVAIAIVEKPGVRFMESPRQPGGAEEGSLEFLEEHTLQRWSEAVGAAIKASLTLPGIDSTRVLVVGHSEGGLVACKVAADVGAVTHVATLAGGGPTQLYDLVELARQGVMCGAGTSDPDARVKQLLAQWDEVLKTPDSTDALFLGHPHRRWTTFLASSPSEELRKTKARVFIGQGLQDKAVFPAGADMLYASLRALGRDVTYSRVNGDHGFMAADAQGRLDPKGWQEMHQRVLEWFLGHELAPAAQPKP